MKTSNLKIRQFVIMKINITSQAQSTSSIYKLHIQDPSFKVLFRKVFPITNIFSELKGKKKQSTFWLLLNILSESISDLFTETKDFQKKLDEFSGCEATCSKNVTEKLNCSYIHLKKNFVILFNCKLTEYYFLVLLLGIFECFSYK